MSKISPESDPITRIFRVGGRFLRSINVQRDFDDPEALQGYVATDLAAETMHRVMAGMQENSSQRAWRLTGDYGSGKSSFALLLANALGGRESNLPPRLRSIVNLQSEGTEQPNLVPVLITGKRERVAVALVRALKQCVESLFNRGRKPDILAVIEERLRDEAQVTDDIALELLCDTRAKIIQQNRGSGLLLIIDELGKFLEFAVLHPEKQDIYFFQRLAEIAEGSKREPLFVVGILHQGFDTYAEQLSQSAQREWEKVAGRFAEVLFNQPLDQIATLVGCALGVDQDQLPRGAKTMVREDMRAAMELGWFGFGIAKSFLESQAPATYPIHPTVLPVLVRVFSRLGQNERSLFSFLLSNEPFGLQWFAQRPKQNTPFYRLDNLYDYVRAAFGHRLNIQSYQSHWGLIETVIDAYASQSTIEISVLKAVGLLNLLSPSEFIPSIEAITLALAGTAVETAQDVAKALKTLQQRGALYNRGTAGYSLWPYTSVDLDQRRKDAAAEIGTVKQVGRAIQDYLDLQPIVARRHYIEKGTLRHFNVHYCATSELLGLLSPASNAADGRIIVPLCENEEERAIALEFAKHAELREQALTLIAVPRPLQNVAGLVEQLRIWEWVALNTPQLNGDTFARNEVARELAYRRRKLIETVENYVGLRSLTGALSLHWFRQGQTVDNIRTGRDLLAELSAICDHEYKTAPRVKHELINRRALSAAGASARQRLIERLFEHADKPHLGMDETKAPPEMSIYLSVLQASLIHREIKGAWTIRLPENEKSDLCNLLPTFGAMLLKVREQPDARIRVSDLFARMAEPPLGIREGLIPLLFAVFAVVYRNQLAFYDNGTFLREVRGEEFRLLIKQPKAFEVQYYKIEGMRGDLFERLLAILSPGIQHTDRSELLDVVKPLCAMIVQLPQFAHYTKRLTAEAIAVRSVVVSARDPVALLFKDLPRACGFDPDQLSEGSNPEDFLRATKVALDELRAAYPALQSRLDAHLRAALNVPLSSHEWRDQIAARAEKLLMHVGQQDLRTFCIRLKDRQIGLTQWIESIAGFLLSKPPTKWNDDNEAEFVQKLTDIAGRFVRVESAAFSSSPQPQNVTGVRVAITRTDGFERHEVLYFSPDKEAELRELQREFAAVLGRSEQLGLVAASRAIWDALKKD